MTLLSSLIVKSYSGYSGLSGSSGSSGGTGLQGTSGFSGKSGYSGVIGVSGQSGYSGKSGYSGISGVSGEEGNQGTSGYSGKSGVSGYSGLGISGTSGYSGNASTLPSGIIIQYAGSSTPSGWLLCDGTAVSRTTYSGLYSSIGTTYGVGDNSTTFNLPDLRGRVPVGSGQGKEDGASDPVAGTATRPPAGSNLTNRSLGVYGGEEKHSITEAELAAHTHTILTGTSSTGGGMAAPFQGNQTTSTGSTGSGTAHNNMMKYITVNFIIKT